MAGKSDLPYDLENLSVPELEALLQQDFIASNGSAPDVDYIMAIMEVIQKKEREQPDYQPLDTEKAWEEFQSFYNTEEGRKNSIYSSDEESSAEQFETEIPVRRKSKRVHKFLLVAAIIVLLIAVTCLPVLGYNNVVQLVAYWTAEQFGFQIADSASESGNLTRRSDQQLPEEYCELQTVLEERGIQLLVPRFPNEFEPEEPFLYNDPTTGNIEFSIMYTQNNDYITFDVIQNNGLSTRIYEKNSGDVEQYICAGITHYIFNNYEGAIIATWVSENLEYCISTNSLSVKMENVIQSMYEE